MTRPFLRAALLATAACAAAPATAPASGAPDPDAPRASVRLLEIAVGAARVHGLLAVPDAGTGPVPLVVLMPDGLDDFHPPAYGEALLGVGLAVLDLIEPDVGPGAPDGGPGPVPLLAAALDLLAGGARLDRGRVGAVGFGPGAAGALALAPRAVAVLYPDCGGLPSAGAARALLVLHGADDPCNPPGACAAATDRAGPGARRHEYAAVGYAWDRSYGTDARRTALLPSERGRMPARGDPAVTLHSARQVARFLELELRAAP